MTRTLSLLVAFTALLPLSGLWAADYQVSEDAEAIRIVTPQLEAAVRKKGYVSGVAAQSLLDKKTGFRDPGFGLDIVDWIMEPPGADLAAEHPQNLKFYPFNDLYHGKAFKRRVEGPQICTQAKELHPEVIRGDDFVAIRQQFTYTEPAPGRKAGSTWTQLLVFPVGKRYFLSMDRIDAVNSSPAMYLRIDMPGHVKHTRGDSFTQIYLSYHGLIPAGEFLTNFAPDERFLYRRGDQPLPQRFIRGYQLRNPATGETGPWLAGMTLDPSSVYEAWCHQRGYVCFIEEIGGEPVEAGGSFSAAFVVGYFDSIDEMNRVYDQFAPARALEADPAGWRLVPTPR